MECYPKELAEFAGEIMDVDSHEMMPTAEWVPQFGPVMEKIKDAWEAHGDLAINNLNHPFKPSYAGDVEPVGEDIWKKKGAIAPGAVDVRRREEVMDAMGIRRQLMFPTTGIIGVHLLKLSRDYGYAPGITGDRTRYGKEVLDAYNDWAIRVSKENPRVIVAPGLIADTVDELLSKTRGFIDAGIRAIWLPAGTILPGGKSPASFELDPFWQMLSDADVSVLLHVGAEGQIYAAEDWNEAEIFDGFKAFEEIRLDPWSLTNMHIPAQCFLVTMVMGWVFERFPKLRFGIMEYGAYWVGPACDMMDLWHGQSEFFHLEGNKYGRLPRKPSDYVKANVRVGPFDFEPVDKYVRQYGLEDVICFASDYPHVEGGNPMEKWVRELKPFGDDVVRKFFVENAKWIMPE